jgi:hypothetical protein
MHDERIQTIEEMDEFVKGSLSMDFEVHSMVEKTIWVEGVLKKINFRCRRKKEKGVVRAYIQKVVGCSQAQLTRYIGRYRKGTPMVKKDRQRHRFPKKYELGDIALLARTDNLHNYPSGHGLKKIMERMSGSYGEKKFEKISSISVSHIYNLRRSIDYKKKTFWYRKTNPNPCPIGQRMKPRPGGLPGYIRIDTVHQGDDEEIKGVYHLNAVDEVTQWEVVASVEKISEAYLMPVLADLLDQFPFNITQFHSDNGSEFINKNVAKLLEKLRIFLSKSRARHCNDNALVEGKNGAVVRKVYGFSHISQNFATELNDFNRDYLNPYLNFHRPCFFPVETQNSKGKRIKKYPYEAMMTPFEKLKSIVGAEKYLKPGMSMDFLKATEMEETDNESARKVKEAKVAMFKKYSLKVG